MKTRLLLFIIVLLIACSDHQPELSRLAPDDVILAFGDSLTYGYGFEKNKSYPALLAELTGRKVVNAGISGEESGAGLKRLPNMLDMHRPKLLILCHGGNDMLRKRDMNQMESNIRAMIKLAQDKDIPVLLLGVPKPGLFLSSYDVYQRIAESMKVIFIKDLISQVLNDNALKSDVIHPNEAGYRMIAKEIYLILKKLGAI